MNFSKAICDENILLKLKQLPYYNNLSINSVSEELTIEQLGFLKTLFSFHPSKQLQQESKVTIDLAYGQQTFHLNGEPISIRKSLIGLQNEYLR